MKKNILIIAPNFPPINKVSSLRPYYLAVLLKEQGWQVTVIAAVDDEDNAGLVRSETGIRVLRFISFLSACIAIVREFFAGRRYDAIVSTYGPTSAHLQGFFAKLLFKKAVWLADYRDLWMSGRYYAENKSSLTYKVKQLIEKIILSRANIFTTVSAGLKANLEKFHHKDVHVIYNGFEPIQKIEQLVDHQKNDYIQICYTGSMYFERSPLLLLQTISEQKSNYPDMVVKVVIAGVVGDDVKEQLLEYENAGLVEYKGRLSREDSYALQSNSDYCLLVENYGATLKGVLTGKVFEYIGMGKPVIALGVAEKSEMAHVIQQSGLMAFCGENPSELKAFVSGLLQNKKVEFEKNMDFITSLERNSQSQKFISLLEQFQSK